MKKMLSLVLALILCLTAVSAFAEAAPSPSLVDKAMELAETVVVPAELEAVMEVNSEENAVATAAFVEATLEDIAEDIDEFYAEVIPAEEGKALVLVATVPMTFDVGEGAELPAEIKITSEVPDNYPEDDEDIKAVYTYLTGDGEVKSIVIEYEFDEEGKIVYTFPADVLSEAEIGVVNFIKIVAE